jgi:Bacterial PH domain
MKTYKAPWSTSLVIVSSLVTLICIVLAIQLFVSSRSWEALVPLAIIFGALLFTVRGYTVTADAVLVHRLFWSTRLPLTDLQSAEIAPEAMRGGLRLFGNGGLFSFTGFFRNRSLGTYRAFVTDPHRTVVLHFTKKTVVISPSAPEDFRNEVDSATRTNS